MRDFTKLEVWRRARRLVTDVYFATSRMPADERYGFQSQMRGAAASIPANIAEGCGRETPAELRRFVSIAAGSTSELENHIVLGSDLGLIPQSVAARLQNEARTIRRMLRRYSESTEAW